MIISMIAAMSDERVIGRDGKLPWHAPADLARFRELTMGHTIVMGRLTYEGIGHPLPGRKNIVLSTSRTRIEGCHVAHSLAEAIENADGDEELFICGGEEVFREALPLAQRLYLTLVHGSFPGEVFFPELPESFLELHREELRETDPPLTFLVYEKVARPETGADAAVLRQKGREALQRKLYFLARRCFEQALALSETPEISSLYAYCLVKTGGDRQLALKLAEEAAASQPNNLELLFNLGRVQILADQKGLGLANLRKGVQSGGGPEFKAELAKCGTRLPPPISALPRNHPLNKYLGKLLHMVGLR